MNNNTIMTFKFYQETDFKQTDLGPLPQDWEVQNLNDYVNFERGTEVGSDAYNKENKGIRFIRVVDLSGSRDDMIFTTSKNIRICNKEDILITFDGSPGIVQKGFEGAYSSGIRKIIIKKNGIHKEYIFYVLQTSYIQKIIQKYSVGVTIKHASKAIPFLFIPLPPLSEQKAIAEVLQTIQDAREKTEAVIGATRQLKKSMMKHLFTYGVANFDLRFANKVNSIENHKSQIENLKSQIKLKDTEIGPIPEHWQVVRLGEVAEIKQGKQLSSKENVNGKIKMPFLRTSNIYWNRIDIRNISYMYFSKEEFEKLKLKKGDILICEGGDVGRTAIWQEELKECAYQNHLHRVRVNENLLINFFLSYFMEYAITLNKLFVSDANRTTIPNLSGSRLKQFLIPLPPLPEQQAIADILQAIDEKIHKEGTKKKALENLFKSMLNNLMSGKLRVKEINNEENL